MTGRVRFVVVGLIGLVMFGAGLWSGYWLWGRETEPTDYRKLLLRVANYMESLEQQNSILNDRLAGLERQQEQARTAAQPQADAELEALRAENAALKAQAAPAAARPPQPAPQ
ncbi:MAG: hypothetical protein BWY87_00213 [Deltaproteobacteria bacterium ADurb.Bin510]|nr:MAG: hypothetical protein BWY87_00213 [Deltaproteobacteria bacterium ADurb.Bin510]